MRTLSVLLGARLQPDVAARIRANQRVLGVDQQVQHHLLQLVRVGEDVGQVGRQRRGHADAGALEVGLAQPDGLGDHLVDRHHQPRRVPLAGEREQLPRNPRGALRFLVQRGQPCGERRARALQPKPLGQRQDGAQRVVQLVRDPRHRLPEGRHLLGLQQLLVEVARLLLPPPPLADVPHEEMDQRLR